MSDVKMCDIPGCGYIFSVLEPGWTTFEVSQRVKDNYGDWTVKTIRKEACANCAPLLSEEETPNIPRVRLPEIKNHLTGNVTHNED